ncbi:MAG: Gfo/Idh/MocA family protein [Candidatus Brocadiia bacterium]
MTTKVGFIGAGGIAGAHMPNVDARDDTEITAICDINESTAQDVAEQFDATPYTDYKAMLGAEDLDAAYVCLPPAAHGTIEMDLVEAGLPFMIEKPIHLDLEQAVSVAKAVEDNNLVTCVGYQARYAPQTDKTVSYVAEHPATLVEGWFVGGMPGTAWWRQKDISGGQAVEQTTHIFDLSRRIVGDVESVCAYGSTGAMGDIENYDIEDASIALLKFESGAVGHICSACVLNDGGMRQVGLKIHGRDYSVDYTYSSLALDSADEEWDEDYSGALGPAMKELDWTFLEAAETGDGSEIRCDYGEGLKSLALCLAVNRSMETGESVSPAEMLAEAGM